MSNSYNFIYIYMYHIYIYIWRFPENGGTQNVLFLQGNPIKINDFGVPPLIFGNLLAWSAVFGGFQHVLPDGNGSVGQWVS